MKKDTQALNFFDILETPNVMELEKDTKRSLELVDRLEKASQNYYGLREGEIAESSNDSYDLDMLELESIEKKWGKSLVGEKSPTLIVGAAPREDSRKRNLLSPMLSINLKSQKEEDLRKWYQGLGGDGIEIIAQPKWDGVTVDTIWKKLFINATLRGNGYIGTIVDTHIKQIESTPQEVPYEDTLEARGEGIMYMQFFLDNFAKKIDMKHMDDAKGTSNPRNIIAGAMNNQLDPKSCAEKRPDVIYYDLGVCPEKEKFTTDVEQLEFMKSQGLKITPYFIVNNEEDLVNICTSRFNELIPLKDGFNVYTNPKEEVTDIMCDGIVLKVNDLKKREELGFTSKGPRFAFAWKFKSLYAPTVLTDVEWSVGRTGRVTPTGVFEPINLGGVTITRATLNNAEYIERIPKVDAEGNIIEVNYGTKIGWKNLVRRSNDVIPEVMGVLSPSNDSGIEIRDIVVPEKCPTCEETIVKIGAHHFCENLSCPDRIKGSLELFSSRDAMNIVGFGPALIDLFVEKGYIKTIVDIYHLSNYREDILTLKGFKEKKVDKILKAIEDSKQGSFEQVLYSLGIPSVGRSKTKKLIPVFKDIDNLIAADKNALMSIDDIGEEISSGILTFFKNKSNLKLIEDLRSLGLKFEAEEKVNATTILEGKTFVITGTLNESRGYYKDILENNGATVSGSVSKKTYAVLIGEAAGSKETKARDLVAAGEPVRILEGDSAFEEFLKEQNIEIPKEN